MDILEITDAMDEVVVRSRTMEDLMDLAIASMICGRPRRFCIQRWENPAWVYQREDEVIEIAQYMLGYCTWEA